MIVFHQFNSIVERVWITLGRTHRTFSQLITVIHKRNQAAWPVESVTCGRLSFAVDKVRLDRSLKFLLCVSIANLAHMMPSCVMAHVCTSIFYTYNLDSFWQPFGIKAPIFRAEKLGQWYHCWCPGSWRHDIRSHANVRICRINSSLFPRSLQYLEVHMHMYVQKRLTRQGSTDNTLSPLNSPHHSRLIVMQFE